VDRRDEPGLRQRQSRPREHEVLECVTLRSFTLGTVNKAAVDQLELGKEYYFDITPAS